MNGRMRPNAARVSARLVGRDVEHQPLVELGAEADRVGERAFLVDRETEPKRTRGGCGSRRIDDHGACRVEWERETANVVVHPSARRSTSAAARCDHPRRSPGDRPRAVTPTTSTTFPATRVNAFPSSPTAPSSVPTSEPATHETATRCRTTRAAAATRRFATARLAPPNAAQPNTNAAAPSSSRYAAGSPRANGASEERGRADDRERCAHAAERHRDRRGVAPTEVTRRRATAVAAEAKGRRRQQGSRGHRQADRERQQRRAADVERRTERARRPRREPGPRPLPVPEAHDDERFAARSRPQPRAAAWAGASSPGPRDAGFDRHPGIAQPPATAARTGERERREQREGHQRRMHSSHHARRPLVPLPAERRPADRPETRSRPNDRETRRLEAPAAPKPLAERRARQHGGRGSRCDHDPVHAGHAVAKRSNGPRSTTPPGARRCDRRAPTPRRPARSALPSSARPSCASARCEKRHRRSADEPGCTDTERERAERGVVARELAYRASRRTPGHDRGNRDPNARRPGARPRATGSAPAQVEADAMHSGTPR